MEPRPGETASEGVGEQVAPFKGATYRAQRASETAEEMEQRPRDRELVSVLLICRAAEHIETTV